MVLESRARPQTRDTHSTLLHTHMVWWISQGLLSESAPGSSCYLLHSVWWGETCGFSFKFFQFLQRTCRLVSRLAVESVPVFILSRILPLLSADWLLPSGVFVFIPLPSPLIRPLSAACPSEVLKAHLKLDRISRRRQRRLHFLPGSPVASGEAGRLIRDTAETTERLKHTWRHETGRVSLSGCSVCVGVWFYFMWFERFR